MSFFDFFSGDETVSGTIGNDQEALGQSIVDQAIFNQSRLELDEANDRAALAFEGQYQYATAGPAYDPTEADPYGFQEILGRAIVQQSQPTPAHLQDDSPLNFLNSADVGGWAAAALGVAKKFVTPDQGPATIGNVPRQVFANRPHQGGGFTIRPVRSGATLTQSDAPDFSMLIVLGLLAVGAYLVLK